MPAASKPSKPTEHAQPPACFPLKALADLTEWDAEWLFRACVVYLSTDLPRENVAYLGRMSLGVFVGRLEDGILHPEHPHTTALITALIGSSKCDFSARPFDTSFVLDREHLEYRAVLRKILRLRGATVERTKDEQADMLMSILPPRNSDMHYEPELLLQDLEHILDFLDGEFEENGNTDHYDVVEENDSTKEVATN